MKIYYKLVNQLNKIGIPIGKFIIFYKSVWVCVTSMYSSNFNATYITVYTHVWQKDAGDIENFSVLA